MASELQATLNRIICNSEVLVERYKVLQGEKDAVEQENEELRAEGGRRNGEIEKLRRENEYLQMARVVTPTRESIAQSHAILSKLVQDVDKCISQLME